MTTSLYQDLTNSRYIKELPGIDTPSTQPQQTPGAFYTLATPEPSPDPKLISYSKELAITMGIEPQASPQTIQLLAGNDTPPLTSPYGSCYGGHQFGHWEGQLGDGRAINLGEIGAPDGKIWEIQTKGSGLTPYSRHADGKAVLRSSVREYLMSEAMFYLGVPTTRALALITTGQPVLRDMFYDGRAAPEPGAIVCRTAPSFIRFGHFEILASRGEKDNLAQLVEFTTRHYFPDISDKASVQEKAVALFEQVYHLTQDVIVQWQRVGFTHGVLNTDNLSILGLTIDYGPYAMLDAFSLDFTPNTTDLPGRRYAYGRQPHIGGWNLERLAVALLELGGQLDPYKALLEQYHKIFYRKYAEMMEDKLGLPAHQQGNKEFIADLVEVLNESHMDYTLFFHELESLRQSNPLSLDVKLLEKASYEGLSPNMTEKLDDLLQRYKQLLPNNLWQSDNLLSRMQQSNPRFILRNHLLYEAIKDLEEGDSSKFDRLFQALKCPYDFPEDSRLYEKAPGWSFNTPGCSTLSCSS